MKNKQIHFLLFCCLLILNTKGYAQMSSNSSVKLDILLNNDMLKEASFDVKLINDIDYTPTGFLLLASTNQFYVLGLGGMPPVFEKTKIGVDAFAVTQSGELWIVSGNTLYGIDTLGALVNMFKLPISGAGITAGNETNIAYLFDRAFQRNKREYVIYQISDKEVNARLLSAPAPILSVFEYENSLLVATENRILCADNYTKIFFELFSLPHEDKIISITGDTFNKSIYFSTQDTIYRVKDGNFEYISTEFGGILKYDGEGLLVFNPEKSLIVRFRNNLLYPQEVKRSLPPAINKEIYLSDEKLKKMPLQEIRQLVLQDRVGEAVGGYSYLVAKDSLNLILLAEYSYALALNGAYDCALMNLDRVRMLSPQSSDGQFFTALVFSLMGYADLWQEFIKNIPKLKTPSWISFNCHSKLWDTRWQFPQLSDGDYSIALMRANQLAASGLYLQAVALYEEIIRDNPSEYLPRVGYSTVLDKLNLHQKAVNELDIAIKMMENDSTLLEARTVFVQRKAELDDKVNNPKKLANQLSKLKNDFRPQTMLYVGGMIAESYVSLNSRFGLFLSNTFNGAVDLGISYVSDNFTGNFGISGYKRFFGFLVLGEGLNLQLGSATALSLKSSLGLSFINNKRNASWDIFFDWYLPLSSAKSSYGISVGRSIYFGKR